LPAEEAPVRAFIIGPIGDRDAQVGSPPRVVFEEAVQVLEEVILPACEAFGIDATRADSIARSGEIPEQICRMLRDSELVIADLTGANPNVMYELGLRHTTGKLTIQLGERERLPFDISTIRTIIFKRTESGLVEARKKLSQALAAGLQGGGDPVTATRVWFETASVVEPVGIVDTDDQTDESGFLEKLADTEEAMQALGRTLTNAGTIMEDITRLTQESSTRMVEVNRSGGSSSAKLVIANRLASLLEDPASRLEVVAGEYAQSIQRMDPGIRYLLQRLAEEPGQLAQSPEFPGQLRRMIQGADTAMVSTLEFRRIIVATGEAARSLRRTARRIATALQSIADSSERVVSWKVLLEQIPGPRGS